MKSGRSLLFALIVAGALAVVAFAADTNQGDISLGSTAQIGSQQLRPGDYTVRWEGTGPSVQVTILRGKKVVATETATLKQGKPPSGHDEVDMRQQDNGTETIERIDFAKRGVSLVFGEAQSASGQ